jgi:tape measure domain-containing protein
MSTKLGTLTLDLIVQLGGFTGPLDQAAAQAKTKMGVIEKSAESASHAIEGMGEKVKEAAAIIGLGLGAEKIIEISDGYTQLQNKLKLVTNSNYELKTAMQSVFDIAQSSRTSVESAAVLYQKFSQSSDYLGLSQKKVADLTKTVSQAVAISGASTQVATEGITQFGQALNLGKLSGQDFHSVASELPGLAKAIALGMGVPIEQLKALADEGKLTTQTIVQALFKSGPEIQKEFDKTASTIGQGIQQINNAQEKFFGSQTNDSAKKLSSALSGIAHNFSDLAIAGEALAAGGVTYYFSKTAAAVINNTKAMILERQQMLANLSTEAGRTESLAAYTTMQVADAEASALRLSGLQRVAFVEKTLIPLQAANTAALEANTIAQEANNAANLSFATAGRGLLGVLGGPVGMIALVATAAAGFFLMGDNAAKARPKLADLGSTADEVTKKFELLDTAHRKSYLSGLTDDLKDKSKDVKKATQDILDRLSLVAAFNPNANQKSGIENLKKQIQDGSISGNEALSKFNSLGFGESASLKFSGLSATLDDAKKSYSDINNELSKYNKISNENTIATQNMSQSEVDAALKAKSMQMQMDTNGKALAQQTKDAKTSLADLKDPTEYGKALRSIQQDQANGLVYSQKDIAARLAVGKSIDDFKTKQEADKQAADEQKKAHEALSQQLQQEKKDYLSLAESMRSPFDKINEQAAKDLKLIALAKRGAFLAKDNTDGVTKANQISQEYKFDTPKGMKVDFKGSESDFTKAVSTLSPEAQQDALAGWKNYFNTTVQLRQEAASSAVKITQSEADRESQIILERRDSQTDAILLGYDQQLSGLTDRTRSEKDLLQERYDFEKRKIMEIIALDPITAAHKKAMADALSANFNQDTSSLDYKQNAPKRDISRQIQDAQNDANHNDQKYGMGSTQGSLFDQEYQIRKKYNDQIQSLQDQSNDPMANDDLKKQNAEKIALLQDAANKEVDIAKNTATVKRSLQQDQLNEMSGFFGNLASLSDSGHKGLAAIGKAAAISQATIQGILAVQTALASAPPPLNFVLAAGVGVAAAVNVAKIAGIGFESGGYTGGGGTKDVAGVVHGQEFVMNAANTAKYRGVLEAMNTGRFNPADIAQVKYADTGVGKMDATLNRIKTTSIPSSPQSASASDLHNHIYNVIDPSLLGDYLKTREGERAFINTISRNSTKISQVVRNA